MNIPDMNWMAIIVAGIASFALGMLWYNPKVFGKTWQQALNISDEDAKGANMALIFGTSLVLMIVMSIGLGILLGRHNTSPVTWLVGVKYGAFIGLAFVATSIGVNLLYQQRPFKLFLVDAGYQLIFLMLSGAIIGAWQ